VPLEAVSRQGEVFRVGDRVWFGRLVDGFPEAGRIVEFAEGPDGYMARVRYVNKAYSTSKYDEVHPVDRLGLTIESFERCREGASLSSKKRRLSAVSNREAAALLPTSQGDDVRRHVLCEDLSEKGGPVPCKRPRAATRTKTTRLQKPSTSTHSARKEPSSLVSAVCVYCSKSSTNSGKAIFKEHPYVRHRYGGEALYLCAGCFLNWQMYREDAIQSNELVLPGETNEELCAVCSCSPDELTLCSGCPRSYCSGCLDKVVQGEQRARMALMEDWRCMACCERLQD